MNLDNNNQSANQPVGQNPVTSTATTPQTVVTKRNRMVMVFSIISIVIMILGCAMILMATRFGYGNASSDGFEIMVFPLWIPFVLVSNIILILVMQSATSSFKKRRYGISLFLVPFFTPFAYILFFGTPVVSIFIISYISIAITVVYKSFKLNSHEVIHGSAIQTSALIGVQQKVNVPNTSK